MKPWEIDHIQPTPQQAERSWERPALIAVAMLNFLFLSSYTTGGAVDLGASSSSPSSSLLATGTGLGSANTIETNVPIPGRKTLRKATIKAFLGLVIGARPSYMHHESSNSFSSS